MDEGQPRPNGLKVAERHGERAKALLRSLNLLDGSMKVSRGDGCLVFPLLNPTGDDLGRLRIPESELVFHRFAPRTRRPRDLRASLRGALSEEEIALLGSSYDVVGGVMLLELPPELMAKRRKVGETLLAWLGLDTVALKSSPTAGETRIRGLEVVAGGPGLETTHRENGLRFILDLSKVFFNPRLGAERMRVSRLSVGTPLVFDMFAGVGPFSINIASESPTTRVCAFEKNPHAMDYLRRNARINRTPHVSGTLGDSAAEVPRAAARVGKADRIIMNLPKSSDGFLQTATESLKAGGWIHYYRLAPRDRARAQIEDELGSAGPFAIEGCREVEAYSPTKSIYVADARLES
jgi:tRNA (guanine37-N1)-methyltransferase